MALETGTYISDLNSSNPTASDAKSQGDDHIRLLKSTIKATFPNVAGAITPTHTELNYVDGVTSAIQTQIDAISGGWRLIKSVAATSGSAVDFVNGTSGVVLDTTYSAYQFELVYLRPSADDQLLMKLSQDGGSNWLTSYVTTQNGTNANGTSIPLSGTNLATYGVIGDVKIFSPGSAIYPEVIAHTASMVGVGTTFLQYFTTSLAGSGATNAVRFYWSGGSTFAGTVGKIRLYGR